MALPLALFHVMLCGQMIHIITSLQPKFKEHARGIPTVIDPNGLNYARYHT
jgi:hypothetical protein